MSGPAEASRLRFFQHLDDLRETLPQPQYALLLRVLTSWARQGGFRARFRVGEQERVHYTPLVKNEMLRAWTLIGPAVLTDPDRLAQLIEDLERAVAGTEKESAVVRGIARASGLAPH